MTIKGTLETFNLQELLQMLAFNQKAGTLVLETDRGTRTIHVEAGRAGFVHSDAGMSHCALRVIRRSGWIDGDRLERVGNIGDRSNRWVGDVALEMGLIDEDQRVACLEETVGERLFMAQLTAIYRFEFADGQVLGPDGQPAELIEPALPVDSLLLDLTRKLDQWQTVTETLGSLHEVFEGTGTEVTLESEEVVDPEIAARVAEGIDGYTPVDRIPERVDVDLFTAGHVAASLFEQGGLRPVETETIVARAEERLAADRPEDAQMLFRRCLERDDAPSDVQLRLADSLEAMGRPAEAAASLDAFATARAQDEPVAVFQALERAARLRGDTVEDLSRLCEYYLASRAWLGEHAKAGRRALDRLLRAASEADRPMEAAVGLAGYLEAGEARSEELLVLADLYEASGDSKLASVALYRRAEDLLGNGRTGPARELLRRALRLDPTRADARRRLHEIDGRKRTRQQRRRVLLVLSLFFVLLLGAGAAWWTYNREAGHTIGRLQNRAESALAALEADGRRAVEAFEDLVDRLATGEDVDEDPKTQATALVERTQELADELQPALTAYAAEIRKYAASGQEDEHRVLLRGLELRQMRLRTSGQETVEGVRERVGELVDEGQSAHRDGRFAVAEDLLMRAANLAFADSEGAARASRLLGHVQRYRSEYERFQEAMASALEAGDVSKGFHLGVETVLQLHESDLTRELRLPVRIASRPAGARVILDGRDTGLVTPCILEYSPFASEARVELRLAGHRGAQRELPVARQFPRLSAELAAWDASWSVELPSGPALHVRGPGEGFTALWAEGGVAHVLAANRRTVHGVDARSSRLLAGVLRGDGVNPIRRSGEFEGGGVWRLLGLRTLKYEPAEGEPWTAHSIAPIDRRPLRVRDLLLVVDERGVVSAFDAHSGEERWRRETGRAPAQALQATERGILLGTATGEVLHFAPDDGEMTHLPVESEGVVRAFPLGEGVLLLADGERGCRYLGPNGRVRTLGPADPDTSQGLLFADGGLVAWREAGGVRFVAAGAEPTLREAPGLGRDPRWILGRKSALVAIDDEGVLREIDISEPGRARYATELGGPLQAPPILLEQRLCGLVGGDLVGVQR